MVLLLVACAAPSGPPTPGTPRPSGVEDLATAASNALIPDVDDPALARAPATAPSAEAWTLAGRYAPGVPFSPSLSEGLALAGADCSRVADHLSAPRARCLVEAWEGPSGRRYLLRVGPVAAFVEAADAAPWLDLPPGVVPGTARHPIRTSWSTLGRTLGACLMDPLGVPPAADPAGSRGFDGKDWVLAFTGDNRCGLGGTLRIDATADRADWRLLTVDGTPWSGGGRALAEAKLGGAAR